MSVWSLSKTRADCVKTTLLHPPSVPPPAEVRFLDKPEAVSPILLTMQRDVLRLEVPSHAPAEINAKSSWISLSGSKAGILNLLPSVSLHFKLFGIEPHPSNVMYFNAVQNDAKRRVTRIVVSRFPWKCNVAGEIRPSIVLRFVGSGLFGRRGFFPNSVFCDPSLLFPISLSRLKRGAVGKQQSLYSCGFMEEHYIERITGGLN